MKPFIRYALILAVLFSQTLIAQETSPAKVSGSRSPLYLKVQFDNTVNLSSLKPGDVAEGDLSRDVYSSDGKVFGAAACR